VVGNEIIGFQALPLLAFIALVVVTLLAMSIRVIREYERSVVFRLGRLLGIKGPGLFFLIPFIDSMVKVDLRIVAADVPEQKIITKDNVTVGWQRDYRLSGSTTPSLHSPYSDHTPRYEH
jgi:regulator of protease activity HflC (stomatin/prohibitin superfamily)